MNITTADRFRSVVFHSECQQRLYTVACSRYNRCQSQVIPHILQNTFRPIGHRTAHRPLYHEYLAPDRTTFSGITSFYTVLWHITLKAIRKKQYSSRASNTPPPGQPKFSFQNRLVRLIPTLTGQTHIVAGFVRRYKCFHGQYDRSRGICRRFALRSSNCIPRSAFHNNLWIL